jgi:hypothetical protein
VATFGHGRMLAAILQTDVVSSTMLEQNDETLVHDRIKALAQPARKTAFE